MGCKWINRGEQKEVEAGYTGRQGELTRELSKQALLLALPAAQGEEHACACCIAVRHAGRQAEVSGADESIEAGMGHGRLAADPLPAASGAQGHACNRTASWDAWHSNPAAHKEGGTGGG